MAINYLDKAQAVRPGEEIDSPPFVSFLHEKLAEYHGDIKILQFPGGYSNLTYLIKKRLCRICLAQATAWRQYKVCSRHGSGTQSIEPAKASL